MINRTLTMEEGRRSLGNRPDVKPCPALPVGEGVEQP